MKKSKFEKVLKNAKDNLKELLDCVHELNIGVKEGSLSVYIDGVKTSINIEKDDTLGTLKSYLAAAGVKTEIDENGSTCSNLINKM